MDSTQELKVNILAEKIKHYLVTILDRTLEEATEYEFYQAFSLALREEIMVNWAAMRQAIHAPETRVVYYLSMEYLPGRILNNTLTNLELNSLVTQVLKKLGRSLKTVVECEQDPGLGNGGLGRLVSCFLDSLATLRYPAMGYGLRYQYGIFEQQLWDGIQIEKPDTWLLFEHPWQVRRDALATSVKYCGTPVRTADEHGDFVDVEGCEEVRALPYDIPIVGYSVDPDFSVLTLRLWSTKESPRNFELQSYNAGRLDQAAENLSLTDVLYPNDIHETGKRIRLKQEFLLVSASLQDIIRRYLISHDSFDAFADQVRIQINDTHPALIVPELMRHLTSRHNVEWHHAWEMTREVVGFTQHTVMKEALEEWESGLFSYLLPRQHLIVERINHDFLGEVRHRFPSQEEKVSRLSILEHGRVRMAHLALCGSHRINGVAALHSDILKNSLFADFYDLYPDRFINITNGVTQRRWLLHCNPELADFITRRIGSKWVTDFNEIARIADFACDEHSQQEFLEIKQKKKDQLVDYLRHHNIFYDGKGRPSGDIPAIDTGSLFDVQVKRIHEYKRQLLNALHIIMLYFELRENADARKIKRTVIVAGKAASGYRMAKNVIHLINLIARKVNNDTTIDDKLKVVFIQNYSVSRAELIIPAADLSEQISAAGLEASGTGNMKLAMNGALTIGTEDGANIEMRQHITDQWWPFRFGASAEKLDALRQNGEYNPWDEYSSHANIRDAVDALRDQTFSETQEEHQMLLEVYHSLLESHYGDTPDHYFILKDLSSFYETQQRVEEFYSSPTRWAEYALHNIAGMGYFSTDRAMHEYAEKVWGIEPTPPDSEAMQRIRDEYAEYAPTLVT